MIEFGDCCFVDFEVWCFVVFSSFVVDCFGGSKSVEVKFDVVVDLCLVWMMS